MSSTKNPASKFFWLVISLLTIFFVIVGGWLFYAVLVPVGIGGNYTKDLTRVYYKGVTIPNADPWTFSYVGAYSNDWPEYAKDANHAYLGATVISIVSDPKSFRYITGRYTKDVNHVYFEFISDVYIIRGADPNTFIYVGGDWYGKDKNQVYFNTTPLLGADPHTFIFAGGLNQVGFAKDATQVYWANKKIAGADPATFQVLGGFYAKDKTHAYFQDRPFIVSDLQSLVLLRRHMPKMHNMSTLMALLPGAQTPLNAAQRT